MRNVQLLSLSLVCALTLASCKKKSAANKDSEPPPTAADTKAATYSESKDKFVSIPQGLPTYKKIASNFITDILLSGASIFVASPEGISISNDGGSSWLVRTTAQGLSHNHVSSLLTFEGKIFAGTDDGLSVSTDGGSTWNSVPNLTYLPIKNLAATSNELYLLSYRDELYQSLDKGTTWKKIENAQLKGPLNSLAASNSTLYIGTPDGLLISTDKAASFTAKSAADGLFPGGVKKIAVDPLNSSLLMALSNAGLSLSTDQGKTWTMKSCNDIRKSGNLNNLEHVSAYSDTIAVSALDGVSLSKDRGATWTDLAPFKSEVAYRTALSTSGIYVATNSGIAFSKDSGVTFSTATTDNALPGTINDSSSIGQKIYAATTAGIAVSTDRGSSWATLPMLRNKNCTHVFATDSLIYAAVDKEGLYVSKDGNFAEALRSDIAIFTDITAIFARGSVVYVGTKDSFYVSPDGGKSWTGIGSGVRQMHVTATAIYVASDAVGVSISTDGGGSFQQNTHSTFSSAESVFADESRIYLGSNQGLAMSGDGGKSWTYALAGLPVYAVLAMNGAIYAGSTSGLYISRDAGKTWEVAGAKNGLASQSVKTLRQAGSDLLVIGTGGLALYTP